MRHALGNGLSRNKQWQQPVVPNEGDPATRRRVLWSLHECGLPDWPEGGGRGWHQDLTEVYNCIHSAVAVGDTWAGPHVPGKCVVHSTMGMRDDFVVEGMGTLFGRSSDGDEWDIVHDLTSFLCPPFKPPPNLAQDPAVGLSGFLFVLLCFCPSPRSREIYSRSRSI